jgi:hypothetical protein
MSKVLLLLFLISANLRSGVSFLVARKNNNNNLPLTKKWIQQQATVPNNNEVDSQQQASVVWNLKDLQQYALQEGVQLSISTLGPGFRTVARSTLNSSAIMGYGEGFVRPSGNILHLDKMEVFQKMVQQVRKENPNFRGGGTTFGVGLLFGYQCLLHGRWLCSVVLDHDVGQAFPWVSDVIDSLATAPQ